MGTNSTHTYWEMTLNNYTETDLALVRQGYPDDICQLIYTLEVGELGTPHVQAYIHMKRDCRMKHMNRLFPRGSFRFLTTLEWKTNAKNYAQKLDKTAAGPAVITNGDPLHTIEGTVRAIINRMINEYPHEEDLTVARRLAEYDAIMEDFTMAKIFVGSTYKSMWKEFGHTMYKSVVHTHTHTHTHTQEVEIPTAPPLKEYRDVEVQTDAFLQDSDQEGEDSDQGSCAGDGTEGDYESDGDEGSEESDCSSIGE